MLKLCNNNSFTSKTLRAQREKLGKRGKGEIQPKGAFLIKTNMQGVDLSGAELQGAYFSQTNLYGSLLPKKENMQGILVDDIDNKPVEDWQKLIDEILPNIPEDKKEGFKQQMKDAEKRTKKPGYKRPAFDTDEEGFISRADFISIQKKLVCKDRIIAKGILNQVYLVDKISFREAMKEVAEHMKKNCPKNIPDDLNSYQKEILGLE